MSAENWLKRVIDLERNPRAWWMLAAVILIALGGWMTSEFLASRGIVLLQDASKHQAMLDVTTKMLREQQSVPSVPCLKRSPHQWLGELISLLGPNWTPLQKTVDKENSLTVIRADLVWAAKAPPRFEDLEMLLPQKISPSPSILALHLTPENCTARLQLVAIADFSKPDPAPARKGL